MKEKELRKLIENGRVDGLDVSLINDFAYDEEKLNNYIEEHENVFSKIILVLAHIQKENEEAKELWEKIIEHLVFLEDRLERKVGISVATLDYFENLEEDKIHLKILNEENFNILKDIAVKDDLTKLYTRDILEVFLSKFFENGYRNESLFCFVMIGIDNFTIINEVHGTQIGDQILKEISTMILENIRKMDIAFRFEGDKLAIIFPTANKQQAYRVMENIRILIRKHYEDNFEATISIGISENIGTLNFDEIIENSNKKLLEAKKRGKNKTKY